MARLNLTEIRAKIAKEGMLSPESIVALVDEIDRLYDASDAKMKSELRLSLHAPPFYLSSEEAERWIEARYNNEGRFEKEEGVCRRCRGEGYVTKDSGCFGSNLEGCPNCDGKKFVTDRIKVPGAELVECKCSSPEHYKIIEGKGIESAPRVTPMDHEERCPKRTA